MTLPNIRPTAFALALALPVQSALAQDTTPQRPGFFDVFNFETVTTAFLHSMLSTARVLADIRYTQISFDPLATRLTLLDLDIRPHLPGFAPDACTITAARATVAGQPLDRLDASRLHLALDQVNVGMGCLPPEARGVTYGLGLQSVALPRVDLNVEYDYASGGLVADISADLDQVAAFAINMDADYVSFRLDPETEEPRMALDLNSAHLTIDDRGGWAMAQRVMPPDIRTPETLQQIVAGAVAGALSDENGVDAPQLSEDQQRFAAEAGALAASMANGARRIVLATNITNGPFRLDEASAAAFQPLFDALAPVLNDHAPRLDTVIPVAVLQSALNSEEVPPNALELGRAMLTGIGTPRNLNSALQLLAKASRNGDAEAAFLIAGALAEKDPGTAYGHALRAAANNVPGALAVLDLAERGTSYDRMIELQNEAGGGPDPAVYGSVLAMRQTARGFLNGTGRYRSYRAAYYWASMAAAAGDASGAAIRDEIEELMRLRGDEAAWSKEITSLENGVLRDWINKDVPAGLK